MTSQNNHDIWKWIVSLYPSKKLEAALKSAVDSDQLKQMFGLEENKSQVLTDTESQVLKTVFDGEKPSIKACYRVGVGKSEVTRPVRICFNSSESVATALRNSRKLKQITASRNCFLNSPDRSPHP